MSVTVIGVRFKEAGKIYYFDPGKLDIKKSDHPVNLQSPPMTT